MSFGSFEEIVRFAVDKEEEAIAIYEEAKHKLALETLYDDYMAKMGD
jgi:rubrerythrin